MFNACKRGSASICGLVRAANSFTPMLRSSRTALIRQNAAPKPFLASRYIHATSLVRNSSEYADSAGQRDEVTEDGALITTFQELSDKGLVHSAVIDEITKTMGHKTMTDVQTLTINELLKGRDIIAQARTGTGKTLGFLVPLIQNILKKNPELLAPKKRYGRGSRATPSDIRAIIISPTRELAEQIAVEAKKLTSRTGIVTQVAVGGNSKSAMLRQMQYEGCHLLVATPGRLNDLLTDKYSRVAAPDLTTLVLDEADRLLDGGFHDAIEDIIKLLPNREEVDRQTMLFSATVPQEVMGLVRQTLKPDFHFVQTVKHGEPATHEKVPQKLVHCHGVENLMPTLLELCKRGIQEAESSPGAKPFKAIVYFGSTANVELASSIFKNLTTEPGKTYGKHPLYPALVSSIHGKLSQAQRTRVADRFRHAKAAVLFSSDVTARGMDFPGVTHVIQINLPPSREQYIHRVGRTGRGSNLGEGWILLTDLEIREARYRLKGLPLTPDDSLEAAKVDMTKDAQLPADLATTLGQVGDATKMVDRETKSAAYLAMLGQLQTLNDKHALVDSLNQWARYGWGWEVPPSISQSLAHKLGIGRVRGVNIGSRPSSYDSSGDSEGRSERSPRSGGFGGGFGAGRDGRSSGGFRDRNSSFGDRPRRDYGGSQDRGGYGERRDRFSFGGDRRGGYGSNRGSDRGYDRGRGRDEYATEQD